MDGNKESSGDLTSCIVCLEDYDTAKKCPRILPCLHTLCEFCLGRLLQGARTQHNFTCPECRARHAVTDADVKQFQQNRYILAYLASLTKKEEMCKDHNRPLTLHCSSLSCSKSICQQCFFIGPHKGHDVVDLVEKKDLCLKEAKAEIENIHSKLNTYSKKLCYTQKRLESSVISQREKIDQCGMVLKRKIDEYTNQLKSQLNADFVLENKKISLQVDLCNNQTKQLQDLKKGLKRCSVNKTEEITRSAKRIHRDLESIGLDEMTTFHVALTTPDDEIKEEISSFFSVTTSTVPGFTFPKTDDVWQIFVKLYTGVTRIVTVRPGDTVGELKEEIHSREGIPTENQVLRRFCGTSLANSDRSLESYNLTNNCNLLLDINKGYKTRSARSSTSE